MRDINRIDPLLERLSKIWKQHPDVRLGQLIEIGVTIASQADAFNIEDELLIKSIEMVGTKNG